QPPGGSKVILF
uniref:Morphogenetic neuropeptide n=5 Tax=Eumetazoa TaxID=6072 RepID=MORN_HUMAN|nr:RecName: Full=Morphogenetic neuropeptide; AltName: Full=Head activator; Short=HA [Bos taurus]P69207.1 RecName: Full=Morphogenetic neuropeptide; AltName: Full=Head activator; Short=HA [Anthopleura elegantissima]P69208.1 RecName: Full=Morphogenetic neuropeptide; AltName: Full=Head activator; Short=HA [Homo sapiens]P69209.1 RecName: Full=Morphogenetic neuropeptide; AltName: Full=Head activator; Short=HA [Rattus norvegicus]P69251.1 RecName: Full=Morphogenetic neuropeptide; AltName: Full=Head act